MEERRRASISSSGPPLAKSEAHKPSLSSSQRISHSPSRINTPNTSFQPSPHFLSLLAIFKLYSYSNKQLIAIAKSLLSLASSSASNDTLSLLQSLSSQLNQHNCIFLDTFQRKMVYINETNQKRELSKLFNEIEELTELAILLISNLMKCAMGAEEMIVKQVVAGVCTSRDCLLKLSLYSPHFTHSLRFPTFLHSIDLSFTRLLPSLPSSSLLPLSKIREVFSILRLCLLLFSHLHLFLCDFSTSYFPILLHQLRVLLSLLPQSLSLFADLIFLSPFSYFPQLRKHLTSRSLKLKSSFSLYFSSFQLKLLSLLPPSPPANQNFDDDNNNDDGDQHHNNHQSSFTSPKGSLWKSGRKSSMEERKGDRRDQFIESIDSSNTFPHFISSSPTPPHPLGASSPPSPNHPSLHPSSQSDQSLTQSQSLIQSQSDRSLIQSDLSQCYRSRSDPSLSHTQIDRTERYFPQTPSSGDILLRDRSAKYRKQRERRMKRANISFSPSPSLLPLPSVDLSAKPLPLPFDGDVIISPPSPLPSSPSITLSSNDEAIIQRDIIEIEKTIKEQKITNDGTNEEEINEREGSNDAKLINEKEIINEGEMGENEKGAESGCDDEIDDENGEDDHSKILFDSLPLDDLPDDLGDFGDVSFISSFASPLPHRGHPPSLRHPPLLRSSSSPSHPILSHSRSSSSQLDREKNIAELYEETSGLMKELMSWIEKWGGLKLQQFKGEMLNPSLISSSLPSPSEFSLPSPNPFLSFLSPPADFHLNFFEPPHDLVDDIENIWDEPINDPHRVVYSKSKLKRGTLNALIIHLTSAEIQDLHFMITFITTYRSFTTPHLFLSKLIQRFHVPSHFPSSHQLTIQLRVCNIIKHWIDTQPNDFDDILFSQLNSFLDSVKFTPLLHLYFSSISSSLRKLRKFNANFHFDRFQIFALNFQPSSLPSPSSLIFQFSDDVIAQQLSLIDFQLFSSIRPEEFLYQSWNKEKFKYRAKNLVNFIKRFNEISRWVISVILFQSSNPLRARAISLFISIADKLHELNNCHAVMAVIAGIKHSSIYRLRSVKSLLPPPSFDRFNELVQIYSTNKSYATYREHIRSLDPPCVPFIGTFLSDLTHIDDGNEDFIDGLINFRKKELLLHIIRNIQQYQQTKYTFSSHPLLFYSLFEFPVLSEEEAYSVSYSIEPRAQ